MTKIMCNSLQVVQPATVSLLNVYSRVRFSVEWLRNLETVTHDFGHLEGVLTMV